MPVFCEREISILQKIIEYKCITSIKLSNLLGVSSRTIKSDIFNISLLISEFGAEIKSVRGKGYSLYIYNHKKFLNLEKELNVMSLHINPETKQERILFLIRKLIMIDYPIRIEEISNELFVSRQTIVNDLKDVKKILSMYSLKIKSSREGLIVDGDEIQKRRCINDNFFSIENYGFFDWNFKKNLDKNKLQLINTKLIKILEKNNIVFSNQSIKNMVTHIFISIQRYRFYQYISEDELDFLNIKNTVSYIAAVEIKEFLERNFSVVLPESEIMYLAMHIHSKSINVTEKSNEEAKEVIQNIFERIYKRYNIKLFSNKELYQLLMMHIPAMVYRVKNKMNMRNPLTYKTMRHYQLAVEVCLEAVDEIEKYYGIELDENEFAYLVLYFNLALIQAFPKKKKRIVLLCGHGRPELIMLLNGLNENFNSQIEKIEVIEDYNLSDFRFFDNDVLITTIPIAIQLDIPIIYIQDRLEKYNEEIYYILNSQSHSKVDISNFKVIKYKDIKCKNKLEINNILYDILKGDLSENEAKHIIDGIFPAFSEVGKKCVILHSLYDSSKPFMKMIILKNEIIWNKTYVKYIFFCSINFLKISEMSHIYSTISEWCDQENKNIDDFKV